MPNIAQVFRAQRGNAPVIERGRHYIKQDIGNGQIATQISIKPIHTAALAEINTAWTADTGAWQYKMLEADYHAHARNTLNAGDLVEWRHPATQEWVTFQPLSLNWTNQSNSRQQIATTTATVATVSDDKLIWTNGYGTGRHFTYQADANRLIKVLTIDAASNLPTPTVTGTIDLELELIIKNSTGVELYLDGARWARGTTRVRTANRIEFRSEANGSTLWLLDYPYIRDANDNVSIGAFELRRQGGNYYVTARFPKTWIDTATFPIYLDPTLTLQPDPTAGKDTWINEASTAQTNAGGTTIQTLGTAGSRRHALIYFDLSSISGVTVTSATLTLYAGSQTAQSRVHNVHRIRSVNSSWIEACSWAHAVPTSTAWAGSAGCSSAGTDYETTESGQFTVAANDPADTAYPITLTTSHVQAMLSDNNGFVITRPNADGTTKLFFSSDYTTDTTKRPKLEVVYTSSTQTVNANAISSAASVHNPAVTRGTVTVNANAISSTSQLYNPALTVGAVTVSPNAISSMAQLYDPAVAVGAVSVSLNAISSSASVHDPAVSVVVTVSLNAIAATSQVYDPALTAGAVTVSLNAIAATSQVREPAVSTGATIIQADFVASSAALHAPSITVGTVTVAVSFVAAASQVHAPSITVSTWIIAANAISSAAQLYEPAVNVGAVTINVSLIDSTSEVYAITLSVGAVLVSPNLVGSASSVYAPEVILHTEQSIAAHPIVSVAQIFLPLVVFLSTERRYRPVRESRLYRVTD